MIKRNIPYFIVIIFAVIAGMTLLHSGLHPTHDGEYHVVRFYEFTNALKDGNYYPRWAKDLNNGYGVPLFNYVYPLPNYGAFLLSLIGVSAIDSFKLEMFGAGIIGAVFFYLFAKEYWGAWGGVISSVFYSYTPYHFVDVYVRGSVGEVLALAFFPGFLWGITNLIKTESFKWVITSCIFLSLVIFSHNIVGLMFFMFGIFYGIFLILKKRRNMKKNTILFSVVILLSLAISSIFWLPALLEQKYVSGLQIYSVSENFPDLFQLLIPSWGTGFSNSLLENQMSFQLGFANIFAVLIGIIVLIKSWKKPEKNILIFFLFSFFATFFVMTRQSEFAWKMIPYMNYFQFPWRFLSLSMVLTSFLAGSVVLLTKKRIIYIIWILIAFFLSFSYTSVAYFHDRVDSYYIQRSNFIDGTNSPGNMFNTIWMDKDIKKRAKFLSSVGDSATYALEHEKTGSYKLQVKQSQSGPVVLSITYFPGWEVLVNEKPVEIAYNKEGLITFSLPKGSSIVEARFGSTLIRDVAQGLFLVSLAILLSLFMMFRKRKK